MTQVPTPRRKRLMRLALGLSLALNVMIERRTLNFIAMITLNRIPLTILFLLRNRPLY